MRLPIAVLLAALLPAAAAESAPPAVPASFSYQGVLLDDQGQARTGFVDLTLRLYDAATGGTLLYVESFPGVPLDAGVFTVVVGPTGDATDSPVDPLTTSLVTALAGDLSGTTPARYLEVTVGVEQPLARIPVLTVPFALRAESSERADSADTADVAIDVTNVGGVPNDFVTQLFTYGNSDGGGPANGDPAEGLGDTDGDGVSNFVDPDNDGDGLADTVEVAQGSDINLVTPVIGSLAPASLPELFYDAKVDVVGSGFEPGVSVDFGGESPAPGNVQPTSFEVVVGPEPAGDVPVQAHNANGESSNVATFSFTPQANGLGHDADDQLTLAVQGDRRVLVGGGRDLGMDDDADGVPDVETTYGGPAQGGFTRSQNAATWDPAGAVAALHCGSLFGPDACVVEIRRDADGDAAPDALVLLVETQNAPEIEDPRIWSPGLAYDASGLPGGGYATRSAVKAFHDRDGSGNADGANELVTLEPSFDAVAPNAGVALFDAAGNLVYAYAAQLAGTWQLRLARELDGDGDFADPGELATVATTAGPITCAGAALDASGRLALVVGGASDPVTLLRDLTGDGDFADAGESTVLAASGSACDVAGRAGVLAAAWRDGAGTLHVAADLDDDGDFADAGESLLQEAIGAATDRVAVAVGDTGRVVAATSDATRTVVLMDPD